jgi:hypothetical protein
MSRRQKTKGSYMNIRKVASFMPRGMVSAACLVVCSASAAFSQSTPAFGPGNLVISRTTYTGTAATVAFPGFLPNNAASVANGTFPNVFNNETPDASFGVTSPIFIDRLTKEGSLISTTPVTSVVFNQLNMHVATSFPSKSELGLHLTPDGNAVTFMAYGSDVNQLDVSNANTPGHVDITNPVNGQGILINQRDVIELSNTGTAQVTTTNTYSGNNGRNVVLGDSGFYYIVGNAGNNGKSVTFKANTVTLTSGSPNVTLSGSSTTANLYVGTPFSSPLTSGNPIPVGAYITAIADSTHFTISANATAGGLQSGTFIANAGAVQLTNVSFPSGATTITVGDTSKLVPGMPLSGGGLAGSYIVAVTSGTTFSVNTPTTAASSTTASYTAAVSNSMLSDDTGVQMIRKGQNDTAGTGTGLDAITNSTVVGKINGTYGTATGYQRGFTITQIGAAADKTGKDDNFRGVTNFNDTIYVSKGSGGNGFDAVYQVNPSGGAYVSPGSSAGLATSSTAAVASINPLPGWPLGSTGANESCDTAKPPCSPVPTVYHPFGIWFANETTLYVADEGATGVSNAAPGGLEKWLWDAGGSQWKLQYTVPTSTIPAYSVAGIGPLQAAGLRNLTGFDNGDGTVTIWAITSTAGQTLNDEGADPNQLVTITDTLAAVAPAQQEAFTVVETAAYGDALRGVVFVPPVAPTVSFTGAPASAPYGSQFTVSGTTNASTTAVITVSGPCSLSGTTVTITGGSGTCVMTAKWAADDSFIAATAQQSTVATISASSLSALVSQLLAAGAIDNAGIANSLISKLDAAGAQIAGGNTNAAKNQLNAFINSLSAQSGKHITQQAADLLAMGAQILISILP